MHSSGLNAHGLCTTSIEMANAQTLVLADIYAGVILLFNCHEMAPTIIYVCCGLL